MAFQQVISAIFLLAWLGIAEAGFESLPKPFTGTKEAAWEALMSQMRAGNLERSRAAASASSAARNYPNSTTYSPSITGTGGASPIATSSHVEKTHSKCNASIQNSYQRMVTDIVKYTLTDDSKKTAKLFDHEGINTFTLTGPTTYTTIVTHAFRPGRPWQAYYPDDYQCCMDCYVYFPEVEVYYWPVPVSEEQCANGSDPITEQATLLPDAKTARAHFSTLSSNNSMTGPVTAVNSNGFTFTSPSIYVAFGDVSAGDACGAVGQKHTAVTLGFAPGELQTVTALGKDHYETALGTRAFDPKNVLCPPDFTPETLFVEQDSLAGISTYRPRIQIPSKLQNLDPKWSSCVVSPYEGIDPPRQLVPAAGWEVDPATTLQAPVQQPTPAMGAPALPENTGSSSNNDPTSHQDDPLPPANQGSSDDPHNEPQNQSGDRPTDPSHDPGDTGNSPKPPNQSGNRQKPGNQDSYHGQSNTPPRPAVVVKGHTITEGAAPVIIDGKPVIYSHGSVYVGGSGAPAPTPGPQNQGPAPVALEGFKFTPAVYPNKKKASNPAVIVQGQRVQQGAPPVTINGKTVQYSSGSVHVGNSVVPVPPARQGQRLPPVIVGGLTVTPAPSHQNNGESGNARPVVVAKGQTITENGPPATINGKPVVYSAGSIIAGGTRAAVPTAEHGKPAGPINVAGLSFTPQPVHNHGDSDSIPAVVVAGHTITEGAPAITVNGAKLAYSGGSIYVNGRAAAFPTPGPQTPNQGANSAVIDGLTVFPAPAAKGKAAGKASGIAIGGEMITPGPNGVIGIAGTTLSPDGPAVTISGTPISLNPSALVIGGSTYILPPATNHAIATIGREIIYQNSNGAVIVGQSTLIPGGTPITISGTIFSFSASGGSTVLVAGSSTIHLSAFPPRPTLNIFSQQVTANANGEYVIAGKTLVPGGEAITVSGTKISLGPIMSDGKEILVVGSSTSTILATTTTGVGEPGSQLSNGLGPTSSVASGAPGSSPTLGEASVTGEQASATEFPGRAITMSVNAMSIWLGSLAWAAYIILDMGI